MAFVYVIESLKNQRYYIGSTNCLKRRLEEHNRGKGRYTRLTKPFKLVYKEKFKTLKEARQREYILKRMKSRKYINQLIRERGLERSE